jgi:tetratricopeptide (TPR) repeat protein
MPVVFLTPEKPLMDLRNKIKTYFKEGELYRTQGLLDEALDKFKTLERLIKSEHHILNKNSLLAKITLRIDEINKKLKKQITPSKPPKVSDDVQGLMKEMFSFDDPETKGSSSLGGAIALAKFGQYDRAIEEFTRLLDNKTLRFEAGKNLLRCWIEQKYVDYAVSLFQKWKKTNFFSPDEMEKLRQYFQNCLSEAGITREIAGIEAQKTIEPESQIDDDDILDINSTRFVLTRGHKKGEKIELEVSFQSGKMIRMLVPKKDKEIIDAIKPGDMINDMVFYSPVAIFSGTGFVSSRKEIEAGPKRGDYSLEIKIIDIAS